METKPLTIHQVCKASGLSRMQLDKWISRGDITLSHQPEAGKSRHFTIDEAFRICAMAELARLGITIGIAKGIHRLVDTAFLHGLKDSQAVLVIWQGPVELISSKRPGQPATPTSRHEDGWDYIAPGAPKFYNQDDPFFHYEIVRPHALASLILDPDKRSVAAINLDSIEARIQAAMEAGDD